MLRTDDAALVADAFDLGEEARLSGPVAAGRLGDIWSLSTTRGRFAVKDSRFPIDPDEVAQDAAFQDVVRAAGVPMPGVVRTTSGGVLADVAGTTIRVYGWVDLLGPTRELDPAEVGAVVAGIHRVVVPAQGPVPPWSVAPVGEAGWTELLGELDAAGCPFAGRLAAILPQVLAVEALMVTPEATQLCHLDLWGDNVLRSPDGGLVVLDWENCGPATPDLELGMVLFEFGCADADRMRTLLAAYADAGGPGRLRRPGDLTMLIAQTGHIAEVGCRRWLAATTDEARADNAAWVAEFLDEPVTVETVDQLLAAGA